MKKFFIVNNRWIWSILLLGIVLFARLPSLTLPPQNDEGAIAYHARLILQGEPLYSTHHPGHHLPGAYYTYALIFRALGDRIEAIKIFLIFWVWINALVLDQIGRRFSTPVAGKISAVFFVLISSCLYLNGETAETELFANLPLTLVIWLAVIALEKRSHLAWYFLIGAAAGIGVIYKAVYLTSTAAVFGAWLLEALLIRQPGAWSKLLKRSLAVLCGFLTFLGFVVIPFAGHGLLPKLWLVFRMGVNYVNQSNQLPLIFVLLIPLAVLARTNLALVCIGLLGTGRKLLWLPRNLSTQKEKGRITAMVILWLLTSVVAAGFSRLGFGHYMLLIIPPLSLLAAGEIVEVGRTAQQALIGRWRQAAFPALLAFLVVANFGYLSVDYFYGYMDYLMGVKTRSEFVRQEIGVDGIESEEIAGYIAQHTAPADSILTWTDQASICYLANRRSSSDTLWTMYISVLGPPQRVIASKPSFIVTNAADFKNQKIPNWLAQELKRSYQLEMITDHNLVYHRIMQ